MKKGFTLVELLVVVAIMGVLAAVGVVAYNGFTRSAKENASRTNHANATAFLNAEFMKCSLGLPVKLKKSTSGTTFEWSEDLCPIIKSKNNIFELVVRIGDHFIAERWKNPYNTSAYAFTRCYPQNYTGNETIGEMCVFDGISQGANNLCNASSICIFTRVNENDKLLGVIDLNGF